MVYLDDFSLYHSFITELQYWPLVHPSVQDSVSDNQTQTTPVRTSKEEKYHFHKTYIRVSNNFLEKQIERLCCYMTEH